LLHGPELGLLKAYIAPLDEVEEICGARALGCYGANRLVMPGDSSGGIPPASVAAREYGHHVATNRLNPPWRAIDAGTKRWASYMNICARTARGTAFSGDEGSAYALNPAAGFAETYRVLNERERGLPFTWPILDASFIPDAEALQAAREDVLNPWRAPKTQTIRVRFTSGHRLWKRTLTTPLDGRTLRDGRRLDRSTAGRRRRQPRARGLDGHGWEVADLPNLRAPFGGGSHRPRWWPWNCDVAAGPAVS
jgi:hypothetical protein